MMKYKVVVSRVESLEGKLNDLAAKGYGIVDVSHSPYDGDVFMVIMAKELKDKPLKARDILARAYRSGVWSSWVDTAGDKIVLHSVEQRYTPDGQGIVAIYEDDDERVHTLEGYGKSWALTEEALLDD